SGSISREWLAWRMLARTLLDLARRPERPKFVKLQNNVQPRAATASRSGGNGYLRSRPSFSGEPAGGGVKLDGVSEGSPAEKAGIKAGDIVIKLGGTEVKDLEGYMAALSTHKPGDEVEIVVKREGKEVTIKVTLGTRPSAVPGN